MTKTTKKNPATKTTKPSTKKQARLRAPASTSEATTSAETATTASSEPAPTGERAASDYTLQDMAIGYAIHMRESGKSEGTMASYRMELTTALEELGAATKVSELTPERVLLYFGSDRVMKKRNGRGKSPLSIDKTRRVLRLALLWAQSVGLVAKAPLLEEAATY